MHLIAADSKPALEGRWLVMETTTFPKFRKKWLIPPTDGRLVLLLLLVAHLCCALLIWFGHRPGLQSWVALPIINGIVTLWLLAKAQTQ